MRCRVPAPLRCGPRLGLYLFIRYLRSGLRFAEILRRPGLRDEIRLIGFVACVVNPKITLGRLEPFQDILVVFQDRCETTLGVRIELLNLVKALPESTEEHPANLLLVGYGYAIIALGLPGR